ELVITDRQRRFEIRGVRGSGREQRGENRKAYERKSDHIANDNGSHLLFQGQPFIRSLPRRIGSLDLRIRLLQRVSQELDRGRARDQSSQPHKRSTGWDVLDDQ